MNKESSKSHVRSMRREISRYMILIIAITLAMVYGLTIFIMYREMSDLVRDQITQEADYIAGALNVSGQGYMRELDQALVYEAHTARFIDVKLDRCCGLASYLPAYPDYRKDSWHGTRFLDGFYKSNVSWNDATGLVE